MDDTDYYGDMAAVWTWVGRQALRLASLQTKETRSMCSHIGRELMSGRKCGWGWSGDGRDYVVSGVPGWVVTWGSGQPRVGEDIFCWKPSSWVTTQKGCDQVPGPRANPLWHLELSTADLGKQ